jgi:hypothetical protein
MATVHRLGLNGTSNNRDSEKSRRPCICFINDEGQDKHAHSRYLVDHPHSTKNGNVAAAVLCTYNAVYEAWLRAKPLPQLS